MTLGLEKYHHTTLSHQVYLDLLTWKQFLSVYSGATFFLQPTVFDNGAMKFWTDSSTKGFGIVFQANWTYSTFPTFSFQPSMTFLELVPIVIGLYLYGEKMANKRILFISDNMGVVDILNKQTSPVWSIMHLVRILVGLAMKHNILFKGRHISTHQNVMTDALSRFQLQRFHSICPPNMNSSCHGFIVERISQMASADCTLPKGGEEKVE